MQIEEQDEVVRAGVRLVVEQVGTDERGRQGISLGTRQRLGDGDLGEVDARHFPPARREPDRVAALAAGEVERASGLELGYLRNEEAVRLVPDVLDPRVARVPVLTLHVASPVPRRGTSPRV